MRDRVATCDDVLRDSQVDMLGLTYARDTGLVPIHDAMPRIECMVLLSKGIILVIGLGTGMER